jgi:ATP-dependent Clp protease ATP-binding subunit ClpA
VNPFSRSSGVHDPAPNFSERARAVFAGAQRASADLDHEYVGTEHLLLALAGDDGGVVHAVFDALRIDRPRIANAVLAIVQRGKPSRTLRSADAPFTSRAKRALDEAVAEAKRLHHSYVGPEHVLLGLLADPVSLATQVLEGVGATPDVVRAATIQILGPEAASSVADTPRAPLAAALLGGNETQAWMRLRSALEITRLLGAQPALTHEPDGTLTASLGADLVITVALPAEVRVRPRHGPRDGLPTA